LYEKFFASKASDSLITIAEMSNKGLSAIGIEGGKGTTLRNCSIRGFDTTISIKEGEVDLDNVTLTHNRTGLQSIDSKVTIRNSAIHDNEIDVLIRRQVLKSLTLLWRN
jgi:hypothetical protein